MFKRFVFVGVTSLFIVSILLTGCAPGEDVKEEGQGEILRVVASISILGDITENIVGERGHVEYLVPKGDNPEDYELLSSDLQIISEADVFLLNGWALEEAIESSLSNVSDRKIVYVTENITPIPLVGDDAADPHAWFDVTLVKNYYVENILAVLVEIDPEGEEEYRQNAADYTSKLRDLDDWIREESKTIPEENRVIVISENALKYFGEAYGFHTEGIWELNSHEEGTPQQISRVVDLVNRKGLPALFRESTLDPRYIETISAETGVPIGGIIYTDALGLEGSGAETYIDMMRYNTEVFVENLTD